MLGRRPTCSVPFRCDDAHTPILAARGPIVLSEHVSCEFHQFLLLDDDTPPACFTTPSTEVLEDARGSPQFEQSRRSPNPTGVRSVLVCFR